MSLSSTSLPKPKNWQDFENKMRELIACVLDYPNTQQNGRSGQKQNGVDIYGYRNSDCLVGIQCKKKFENSVTEKELRDEVIKAKAFKPRISEFILVTTAPRDQKNQECARLITNELKGTSHPIHVSVWGWDEIEDYASKYDKAWKAFDPTWNPFVEEVFKNLTLELKGFKKSVDRLVDGTLPSTTNPSHLSLNENDENTPLHGQITALQRLLDDGHVKAAHAQLIKLKTDEWSKASRSERYRILVGIASARLKLGEEAEAGTLLLNAYNECPEHKNARRNKATGLLLLNSHDEAAKLAKQLLVEDKSNADAAGTLIQALIKDSSCDDPLRDVPEELCTTIEVSIAYVHFLRCRENPHWVDIARSSARKHTDCHILRQFAAEAVLDELVRTDRDAIVGGKLKKFTSSEVTDAVETLYSEARDAIDKGYALLPSLAHNAALALRFVDDLERAKEILDAAIKQFPDVENLKLQRGLIAFSENDPAETLRVLPDKPIGPEAVGLLAQSLAATGKLDDAISLIIETDETKFPEHVRVGLLDVRIRAYISKGDKQAAINIINQQVALKPDSFSLRILQIQTFRAVGDTEGSITAFEEVLRSVDAQANLLPRLALSFEALKLGRDEAVVDLLKQRVATDRANEGLHILIATCINAGFWLTAHETLDAISTDLRSTDWFRRADAILAINTGDPNADNKICTYLKYNPSDAQMIIARIGIWQRSGQKADIQQLLNGLDLENLVGAPELCIQIAAMITHYGEAKKGLEYGYAVLMDNWDKPKAHLSYQSLILFDEVIASVMPSAAIVAENTVVTLLTEGGERKYRIERQKHQFFEDERLSPESDLAILLIGKQPGSKFILKDRIGAKPVEVRQIKPVYIDAFHSSLEQFNERFPHAEGLLRFNIDHKAQDPFEDIRAITKAQAEVHERLLGEYQSKALPLSFAAAFIGKDPIEAWSALPTVNVPFQVCHGFFQERDEAIRILTENDRKGCMVDAITLSAIRRLGVEKAVIAVCGKIHTTQSVVDLIASRELEARRNIGKQKGFLGWRDGQLLFEEHSEETLQKVADDRAIEMSWVNKVAAISPAMPKKEFSQDTRSIINMVGHVASDPAVAADGNNLLLLSDDMGFRTWASATFKVQAVWLQPILTVARDEGSLPLDDYCDAINMLALSGHTYISLDVNCLMRQARKDNFVLTHGLSRLIRTIGGPSADLRSNSRVMSEFITAVMKESLDILKAKRIVSEVFHSISNGRQEDHRELIVLILKQLKSKKDKIVKEHALSWLIGHSIGMPYFNELLSC